MQQTTVKTKSESSAIWNETDRRMMARALELATQGVGRVSPGPLVGCVLAHKDGQIVGEGFYLFEQVKHAETIAIEQAGSRARGATAYISLEPHAHYGRTPPCTDALISAGIRRVVAPIEDPNPVVSGKGFSHLSASGIEVSRGLLAAEAERVNEKYIYFMRTGRPFVHLKIATSLDGKIATRTGDSRWITGEESRARVHELRHEHDAILVGAGTVAADDPLLTDRSGKPRRRPLLRVVLDGQLKTGAESHLARTARETPVLVFASPSTAKAQTSLERTGVEVMKSPSEGYDLEPVLAELRGRDIQSVLVEGGAKVAGAFLDAGLVNKVTVFVAPLIIGGSDAPSAIGGLGAAKIADAWHLENIEIVKHGDDLEITGYPVEETFRPKLSR
ncbi:MAG: bifunctional diaminohydroxyphosphoribosylaminopyrimidine deaminase/5-amino-6-(5-phosphoribosylamino)uracil reductase RibD [Pyrinomonadaceae bacterium]